MPLTYGGIPLAVPSDEVAAWISANVPLSDLHHNPQRTAYVTVAGGTRILPSLPMPDPELGRLFWPVGASRWAYGHFLCSEAKLSQIKDMAYTGANKYKALPLVMDDGYGGSLTTSLFMLTPIPLQTLNGLNLWLLTLVDERYFWQGQIGGVTISSGTTWDDVFAELAGWLGLDAIGGDAVDSAYLDPPAELLAVNQSAGPLLDLIAEHVGQRIVRKLDGTVESISAESSLDRSGITVISLEPSKVAGGLRQSLVSDSRVVSANVPGTVRIGWQNGSDDTQTLAALSLAEYGNATGTGNEGMIRPLRPAPTVSLERFNLRIRMASDWYRWQLAYADLRWSRVRPWEPDGHHDCEWSLAGTRVYPTMVEDDGVTIVSPAQPAGFIPDAESKYECEAGSLNLYTRDKTINLATGTITYGSWVLSRCISTCASCPPPGDCCTADPWVCILAPTGLVSHGQVLDEQPWQLTEWSGGCRYSITWYLNPPGVYLRITVIPGGSVNVDVNDGVNWTTAGTISHTCGVWGDTYTVTAAYLGTVSFSLWNGEPTSCGGSSGSGGGGCPDGDGSTCANAIGVGSTPGSFSAPFAGYWFVATLPDALTHSFTASGGAVFSSYYASCGATPNTGQTYWTITGNAGDCVYIYFEHGGTITWA